MSSNTENEPELFLALRNDGTVHCRRCGGAVDFALSCQLHRTGRGHLEVTMCHQCLIGGELGGGGGGLVDVVGDDGARAAEITRALSFPAPGSHWRYTDPRSPADRLEFSFVRHVGDVLVFAGPHGDWHCAREDWANHLATMRVRPLLLPARASA